MRSNTVRNRLLIVEHERDLAMNLIDHLDKQGYVSHYAGDGHDALRWLAATDYDLVVLDLLLPGVDGMCVCSHIRRQLHSRVPILVLTARDEIEAKEAAFAVGADDCVIKPASLREISARIHALIRRSGLAASDTEILRVGDLCMDTGTLQIERAGVSITLAPVPMKILAVLMRHSPNVVHHLAIHKELWGKERGGTHAVFVHMRTLRNVIDKPFGRPLIHTVHGFGYRIADDQEDRKSSGHSAEAPGTTSH